MGSIFAATPRSRASVGLSSVASRSMARPASAPDPGEVISLAAAAAAMASTTADSGTGDWPMRAAAPGELSAARAMALRGAEASGLFPLAAGLGAGTAGGLDLPALEDLLVTDFFAAAAGLEPAAGGLGLARFAGGGEVNLFGFEIFLFARPSLTPLTAGGGVAAGATADMLRTSRCQGTTRTAYRAGRVRHARSLVPYPVAVGSIFELFRAVWNLSARKVGRFLLGFDAFTRAVTRPSRPAGFGAPVRSPQPSRASPRPVFRVPPACVPRGQRAFRSIRGS